MNNSSSNPEMYADICPNCNGRATVGLNPVRDCPTCSDSDHPGVIYIPTRMNERKEYDSKI